MSKELHRKKENEVGLLSHHYSLVLYMDKLNISEWANRVLESSVASITAQE